MESTIRTMNPAKDSGAEENPEGEGSAGDTDDAALLAGIARGEKDALALLYDRHSAALFGLALRILRHREPAEDALQEVFVRVWRRAESFDAARGSAAGWLFKICRNHCLDVLRSRDPAAGAGEILEEIVAGKSEDALEQQELRGALRRALDGLDGEGRRLVEMAYYGGRTRAEIARETGLPLGTVKSRIRACLRKMRAGLDGLEPAQWYYPD